MSPLQFSGEGQDYTNAYTKGGGGPRRPTRPIIKNTTNMTKNMKNSILAMPAAATAMPPKPKAAAIIAIMKNIRAQLNMIDTPLW